MDIAHCCLDGNVDAVEFCPHDTMHSVLAAATYTLKESEMPQRSGSISLFNVDPDVGRLELFHHVDTSGIFDIKWIPVGANHGPVLGQVDAEGCLRLYSLRPLDEDGAAGVLMETSLNKLSSSSMCLCLDWESLSSSISVGLSDGSVSIISLKDSQLNIQRNWKPHDFEVWATCFHHHQPQLIYTGSDDCRFCCWDLRDRSINPAFHNQKDHKMGVCCIANNASDANSVLTGSYDEYLRVWDVRSISKPVNESQVWLGGGVWRIKVHPFIRGVVLAACMHNGFAVIDLRKGGGNVIESYAKHGSLAYGGDWWRGNVSVGGRSNCSVVATCSFYDRMVRLWIPDADFFV